MAECTYELWYKLGAGYQYVKLMRFASPAEAAVSRRRSLEAPNVPEGAYDVEVGELRGPDIAEHEAPVVGRERLASLLAALNRPRPGQGVQ